MRQVSVDPLPLSDTPVDVDNAKLAVQRVSKSVEKFHLIWRRKVREHDNPRQYHPLSRALLRKLLAEVGSWNTAETASQPSTMYEVSTKL